MLRIILFLFFAIMPLEIKGQINFMKTFGGNHTEFGLDIAQRKQGGYFICGETLTPAFTFFSCENYFVTTDVTGALQGSFSTGHNGCDFQTCMRVLPDSGYVVAGSTLSYGVVEHDIQIIRFDKNNNIVWAKRLGGSFSDVAYGIALTHDGGFAIAGFYSITSSNANRYVAKLDANGNLVWTCVFGDASFERLNSIERTSDNGFIVSGVSDGPPAVAVSKISATGVLQWNTILKGTTNDQANHAIQTYDGGYAVTGYSYSYSSGSADIMLCKLNAAGNLLWYKSYGNTFYNDAVDLAQTPDSGIVIAGTTWNGFYVNDNVVVMKTDKNGNLIYAHEYGEATRLERAAAMDTTADGGFAITGFMWGCPTTDYEVLLLKTLPNGTCPNCDSNVVTFTTTTGTPNVVVGSIAFTTGGNVNTIAPLKKNDASNMTSCSAFSPLPIQLINFEGKLFGNKNILYWATSSETNNDYFTLLKSANGINFEPFAKIESKSNGTQTTDYTFVDEHPFSEINYYQLQQTDVNGQTSFSKTIAINSSASANNQLIVTPNPANSFIQLSFTNSENIFQVEIINALGKVILYEENKNEIDVSKLADGLYFIKANSNNVNPELFYTQKFIKQ